MQALPLAALPERRVPSGPSMCGIAGRVNFKSGAPVDPQIVASMCALLAHRGPDGQDVWAESHAALGHRRLAIIDLSDGGRQPMASADGRFRITFNGEIYNFRELRGELEATRLLVPYAIRHRGHRPPVRRGRRRTASQRLNGMFALAIWDRRARTLFLARDRVGKKPLYYRRDGDGIAFASEPKAFLAEPGFAPSPIYAAIDWYLSYQYVPAPLSALADVRRLEPAHSSDPERRRRGAAAILAAPLRPQDPPVGG